MKSPHPNCYWVEPDLLLAGEYPRNIEDNVRSDKLQRFVDAGVGLFVDLTEEYELDPYHLWLKGPQHVRMPIRDMSIPSVPQMVKILDTLDDALEQEILPYVHCWGGIGRTGTVVGCWLARHSEEANAGQAGLRELGLRWQSCAKSVYCDSPQTPTQLAFVRNWKAGQ